MILIIVIIIMKSIFHDSLFQRLLNFTHFLYPGNFFHKHKTTNAKRKIFINEHNITNKEKKNSK